MKEKQQIIHIHGGNAFDSYNNYISFLKKVDFNFLENNKISWNKKYSSFLDENKFEVYRPIMPCAFNASYEAWSIWFERYFPFLREDIILVGHSLGGIFLAKYLSENKFPFKIKQLHLVAPVYDYENEDEQLADFKITEFPKDFFRNEINEIHIYHSEDDSLPILESEKYFRKLPTANFHRFEDRGHFLDETFPELFENIKKPQ